METYSIMLFSEDGQMKRLKLSDVPACKRTTKGITLYKNLKTKTIYVHSALIMTNKDEAKVYTDQETYDLKATDFKPQRWNDLLNIYDEVEPDIRKKIKEQLILITLL